MWPIQTPEYSGPYRWDEAKERIPNDYRTKDDLRAEYPTATGKEVWETMKEDELTLDTIF